MARSNAATVEAYLRGLPDDRREVMLEVRSVILKHLPKGYQEAMNWGMISYEIPLDRYPDTRNGQPLMYAALAANKNGYSLHLMALYGGDATWLKEEFANAGKRLDMGKSCVRFRRLEDLPLDVIGRVVGQTSVEGFIALYETGTARPADSVRSRRSRR